MNLLIADDHPLFREALGKALATLDPELQVHQAGDCRETLQRVDEVAGLDLVLLDLAMPGMDGAGWAVLDRLRANHPALPVVVLSASEAPDDVARALQQGALGFIPKSTPTDVLLPALRLVLAGGIYAPPHLVGKGLGDGVREEPAAPAGGSLTPRQQQVVELLAQGQSNKAIGHALGLSPETVKVHIRAICRALGAQNRTHAVQEAERRGILAGGRGDRQTPG